MGEEFFNYMNSKKIILILVLLILLAGIGFYFYRLPPLKYWTKNPTNFEECKEATRGFIITTLPAQCEFRGQNFVDQSQGQIGILNSPSRQNSNQSNQTFSESEILASLKTNWQSTQSLITFRPSYHNQAEDVKKVWRNPSAIRFIGKNNVLVRFEDDNNVHVAVFNFNGSKFNLLEVFKNQSEFTLLDWQNLVNKYGDTSYSVSTYTTGLVRNKQIVSFPDLTKVSENIFVKNYWEQ